MKALHGIQPAGIPVFTGYPGKAAIISRDLLFNSSNAVMVGGGRAGGYSVRCLKD